MAQNKRELFARLLVSVSHAVTRTERERVCCGELTFQQFETLRRIERDGTDTVSAVAVALGIDDSTGSRNVGILVRDGYLKRTRDQDDGRSFRLGLTSKGRAALTTLTCDERDVFGSLYDEMSPGDRITSLAALAALDAALALEPAVCCPPSEAADRPRRRP